MELKIGGRERVSRKKGKKAKEGMREGGKKGVGSFGGERK